jgi:hypothetical protein
LRLSRFRIQMGEDLLDDLGILDARNDPHCPAAGRTSLDVDAEGPFQALRPGHRRVSMCRQLADKDPPPADRLGRTNRAAGVEISHGGAAGRIQPTTTTESPSTSAGCSAAAWSTSRRC